MSEKIIDHHPMLADRVRLSAYQKAITETVRRGDVVVDLGTGSGILAFFAVQAGAKKVYAIEENAILDEAKQLAKFNRVADKIVFIKERSDRVTLPEKADVIISELIGLFGLDENLHHFKLDARDRFLSPEGKLVPSWLELYLVPVAAEGFWQEKIGIWNDDLFGVNYSSVKKSAASQRYIFDGSAGISELAEPVKLTRIDFNTEATPRLVFEARFKISKNEAFHGFLGFFKAGLSLGVTLSTAPDQPLTHWQQTFFPLEQEIKGEKGDVVTCQIKAIPMSSNLYWEWRTEIARDGITFAEFIQSDFDISSTELVVGSRGFRPVLTKKGMIRRRILNLCDGKNTREEIADQVLTDFPGFFSNFSDANKVVLHTIRSITEA